MPISLLAPSAARRVAISGPSSCGKSARRAARRTPARPASHRRRYRPAAHIGRAKQHDRPVMRQRHERMNGGKRMIEPAFEEAETDDSGAWSRAGFPKGRPDRPAAIAAGHPAGPAESMSPMTRSGACRSSAMYPPHHPRSTARFGNAPGRADRDGRRPDKDHRTAKRQNFVFCDHHGARIRKKIRNYAKNLCE